MSETPEPDPDDGAAPDSTPARLVDTLNLTAVTQAAADVSRLAARVQQELRFVLGPVIDTVTQVAESTRAVQSTAASMMEFRDTVAAQLGDMFAAMEQIRKSAWPANWAGVDNLEFDVVEAVCVDEGIPLMWVPRPATVQALLAAPDAGARRRLLGQRWRGILADCRDVLDAVADPGLQHLRGYGMEALDALAAGHAAAAQSLAANLLDTIITGHFHEDLHDLLKRRKAHRENRWDLDEYQFRAGLALAPVWSAYAHYYANRGDAVPRQFARNATAHSVSRRQFSRVNAVIAVMVVTSLLRLVDHPER